LTECIILLVISLGIILAGAELFTNGIEWFGRKLQLAEGAVGSVLAAVGTALPETIIPIIAIFTPHAPGAPHSGLGEEIGIGAILGAPLMLSTVAFFVTGVAVFVLHAMGRRTLHIHVDPKVLGRDLRTFFLVYAVAIGAMFITIRPLKIAVAVFLIGAYVVYVRRTFAMERDQEQSHELGRLHFHRRASAPRLRVIVAQVLFALLLIVGGARLFVENLSKVALASGVSAFVLATIITPIATELPEKFNSVTWVRQRKDTLALGNISGAMVFQSSVLPALGLSFTAWAYTPHALVTGLVAIAASFFAWAELTWHKRLSPYSLLAGILFYGVYLLYVFVIHPH
jgi:cation:H+ antiporter